MKLTVQINGADSGLIERLTAVANRRLVANLKHLAARESRRGRGPRSPLAGTGSAPPDPAPLATQQENTEPVAPWVSP